MSTAIPRTEAHSTGTPRRTATAVLAMLLAGCGSPREASETPVPALPGSAPNVLLLCIDDLRPELGCYGEEHVKSPNLDALAASGMRFDRHYVQFPTCGASRFSFLTGQRPSLPAHYGNGAFSSLGADFDPMRSLPGAFRAAGYRTVCLGKISHSHDGSNGRGEAELPGAWDAMPTDPGPWKEARHLLHGYLDGSPRIRGKSPISENVEARDEQYPDGILAAQAVEQLRDLSSREQPFFLAVGFFKPHLPFAAPQKYWDLYERSAIPPSPSPDMPKGLPNINAWNQSGEVTNNYQTLGYANQSWSITGRQHLRHGYLACVSYVDAQVGKVLDELERLGLDDDTIVVVWGDHGWHLGDLALFGKHTTYEASLRATLLMRAPGVTVPGSASRSLIEALDVFPTLTELCGLGFPDDLPGRSFRAVLANGEAPHREAAQSYWRRGRWLGTSLRTDRYRLIGWSDPIARQAGPVELYDLEPEPGGRGAVFEARNIAASRGAIVDRLVKQHLENPGLVRGQ
jgi:iduronate 2-sulfatase